MDEEKMRPDTGWSRSMSSALTLLIWRDEKDMACENLCHASP